MHVSIRRLLFNDSLAEVTVGLVTDLWKGSGFLDGYALTVDTTLDMENSGY